LVCGKSAVLFDNKAGFRNATSPIEIIKKNN